MEGIKLDDLVQEIKKHKDVKKLNKLMDKVEENVKLQNYFLQIIKKDQKLMFFILINRTKADDFLKLIKEDFKLTNWYYNIEKHLVHPDNKVAAYFLNELGEAKSEIFLDVFLKILKDRNWELKKLLSQVISKYKDKRTTSLLVSMLDESDNRVVKEVIIQLSRRGNDILPYLEKYINLPMPRIKMNILDLLNKIKTMETLAYLIKLAGDNDERIKREALQTISFLIDRKEIDKILEQESKILEILKGELEKTSVRNIAGLIKILLKFKEKGSEIIINDIEEKWTENDEYIMTIKDIKTYEKIYLIILMLHSNVVELRVKGLKLLDSLEVKDENEEEILEILGTYILKRASLFFDQEKKAIVSFIKKSNLLEKIMGNLNSENAYERKIAAEIIGIIDEEKIFALLIPLLNDPEKEIRIVAIKILSFKENEAYLGYFEKALEDPEEEIQAESITAMFKLHSPQAKALVFSAIDHPNKMIRDIVSDLIAKENLQKYVAAFENLDETNKKRVAGLIEKFDGESLEILSKNIKSTDLNVRKKVVKIISYIENKEEFKEIIKIAMIDPDKMIRSSVVKLLVNLYDKEVLEGLLKLLNDPDKRVRANTIEVFGTLKNKASVKLLLPFLEDKNNRIRANAIIALYEMGYKDVIGSAHDMIRDDSEYMRASGVFVIGVLRAKDSKNNLLEILDDPSKLVRQNLIKALCKLGENEIVKKFLSDDEIGIREFAKKFYKKRS